MIMTVQDKLFPYRIWGKDSKVSVDSAIEALAAVVSKLRRVQRTQWVLLNGMHGGSLFLQLAVISGVITWEDYRVLSARMRSLVLKRRNTGQFAVCSSKGNSLG